MKWLGIAALFGADLLVASFFLKPQWLGCACAVPSPVICNYAGSPNLDPEIPDACELGQEAHPG